MTLSNEEVDKSTLFLLLFYLFFLDRFSNENKGSEGRKETKRVEAVSRRQEIWSH